MLLFSLDSRVFLLLAGGALVFGGFPGGAISPAARGAEEIRDGAGEAESRRGAALFDQGNYAGAAEQFARALAAAPANSRRAQLLGRALGLQARDASLLARPGLAIRSRDALEKAVALDPENLGARSDLAAFYAAAPGLLGGGLEKARRQVAEIARRDPYLGQVRAADLLLDAGQTERGREGYLAAERADPRRPDAHYRLAYLANKAGDHAAAFAQLDLVLARDPGAADALFALGRTAAQSGQRLEAGERALRAYLQAAAAGRPRSEWTSPARARLWLGRLAQRRGDLAGARAEFEQALRLEPGLREARQALDQLPAR